MDIFRITLCRDVGNNSSGNLSGGMFGPTTADKNSGQAAEQAIQASGQQLYDRSKQTSGEADQYNNSFDIGKFLQQYFGAQAGMNAAPAGSLNAVQQYTKDNPLAQGLYDQTLSDVNDPDKYYHSTLTPDLAAAQDTINTYYQKRGLLNSGLAIEGMGRAGVDLAIKDAQARQANRQTALSNATNLNNNIYTNSQQNFSNLANLYNTQQNAGLKSLDRQANAAGQAAGYQSYGPQAQLGSYYGSVAAMQALPGQLISAGAKVAAAGA